MISLPDREALGAALSMPLPAALYSLLSDAIALATEGNLLDLTYVVIIEEGDTEADIIEEIGFSPLVHPIDGHRYGDAQFQPYWAYLQERGGWFELIHTVSNDGFAFVLLVDGDAESDLVRMCRRWKDEG
ncbi:hypothetical protein [Novosphingobium sp. JCM 18896]|uniref:hypothetical protein n=1 Tax=Novosphingobium sp. JCM 18896 TaxID=2989731 RepID=UPI0022226211|nr:hypothetical protein [Novosphingobium sp. JCM 18896]MCW1431879.1 hypothetical protein [Novosphingobium sp. JCM 18896]